MQASQNVAVVFIAFLMIRCIIGASAQDTVAEQEGQDGLTPLPLLEYTFADLKPCTSTSIEIGMLGPEQDIEPCIIYDIQPSTETDGNRTRRRLEETENNDFGSWLSADESIDTISTAPTIFEIPIVQVTPSDCYNSRDGAATGVKSLNSDNDGRGVAIGFRQGTPFGEDIVDSEATTDPDATNTTYTVQFRLVSVIAGNPAAISEEEYERRHVQLLSSMLETLRAPYIVGTCSWVSPLEKKPANDYKAILMAQIGPPSFYEDSADNPYVFGFHINSDTYPLPSVRSLAFWAREKHPGGPAKVPVRVVSRTQSEFFESTCKSAIAALEEQGFTDVEQIWMDHIADEDGDGTINQFDEEYLLNIADRTCPPPTLKHEDDDKSNRIHEEAFHPALFVCSLTEQDILLRRWLENGCRPVSLWLTASTWNWATDNPELVPFIQGGGQWHESFDYSDKFFSSGVDLIEHNAKEFGYTGTYDQVVSYAIPLLYAEHLISSYRVVDDPNPVADFASDERRELLRRDMIILQADTIFGPVSFDKQKRNVGRGAAGSQWLQPSEIGKGQEGDFAREQLLVGGSGGETAVESGEFKANKIGATSSKAFKNTLVAPFLQASASTVIPSPSAGLCGAGRFGNETHRKAAGSLLESGCSDCPVDTFHPSDDMRFGCRACPPGSSTNGMTGQTSCFAVDDNLLSFGVLFFGYVMVAITWILCFGFMAWIWANRKDPVVKVSQQEFLVLICVGALISSSTIIALSFQAGSDEDISQASVACTVAPFLYTIGWAIQYSSLTAKTFRLFTIMKNNQKMRRVKVTFRQMSLIVIFVLTIDIAILISWTVISPLVYERSEESINVDSDSGVITVETTAACVMKDPEVSFWAFAGPLMGIHFLLLIITNVLLCFVRDVSDRYQEQKYVGLASMLMFEILIVGLPVLVAVNDNSPAATYIILVGIIALADIGILCFTFVPKIRFQRTGLEEGVGFGESIMRKSYLHATTRERVLRDSRFQGHSQLPIDSSRHSLTSNQVALAAAVVSAGAISSQQGHSSLFSENLNNSSGFLSSVPPVSLCGSAIPEETDSQVDDSDKWSRLNTLAVEGEDVEEGPNVSAHEYPSRWSNKAEEDSTQNIDAPEETPRSAADGTATTASFTGKSSTGQDSHNIPLMIETDSFQHPDCPEAEDDLSSGKTSSRKEGP